MKSRASSIFLLRKGYDASNARRSRRALEIDSFAGTDAVESEGRRVIKQLERIAETDEALLRLLDTVVRRIWPEARS